MPDSAVVEVALGLALVFAAFSVAVSRVNESWLGLVHSRARLLEAELRRLVGDDAGAAGGAGFAARLLDGPLRGLRTGVRGRPIPDVATCPPTAGWRASVRRARRLRLPSYIPSLSFAEAVVDCMEPPARVLLRRMDPDTLPEPAKAAYRAAHLGLTVATAGALHAAVDDTTPEGARAITAQIARLAPSTAVGSREDEIMQSLPDGSPLRSALLSMSVRAAGDRDELVAELARWYDAAMDRLSGRYKRRVQRILVGYGIVVTVLFNLDAVAMTEALWQNGTVRAAAVAAAQERAAAGTSAADGGSPAGEPGAPVEAGGSTVVDAVDDVRAVVALRLPFGWDGSPARPDDPRAFALPHTLGDALLRLLGWVVSALAVSLAAPFWFDLLGRVVNVRDTGPRPRPA
jgi:hypothetical protein